MIDRNSSKEDILKKYERTISYMASKLSYNKDLQDDLKQEGLIGLLYAIDKYDYDLVTNKTQHSFYCDNIKYSMMDYLMNYSRIVRIPVYKLTSNEELRKFNQKVSLDAYSEWNGNSGESGEWLWEGNSLLDFLIHEEEEEVIDEDKLRVIIHHLYKLTPYQQQLFKLHFFDGYSKTDLSKMIIFDKKVTRQNIGQHINSCLSKIKSSIDKSSKK